MKKVLQFSRDNEIKKDDWTVKTTRTVVHEEPVCSSYHRAFVVNIIINSIDSFTKRE